VVSLVEIGVPSATGDPLSMWRPWTEKLSGAEVDSGHFMPEENPAALLATACFFLGAEQ
jgi:haloacetate dehalogenase